MATSATSERARHWQLWALLPILLLVGVVSLFAAKGGSIVDLLGTNPPPTDELDIRRVTFKPGEIQIRVTNPQRDAITIGAVTVDDAIVPYTVDGPTTLDRLRSSTIVVPFDWVEDEPIAVGVTSSTGIQVTKEIAAAVETPGVDASSVLGYALIGILVGVVPILLGLIWLPAMRGADPRWLAAFMALTGGLLTFLALDALSEALALQATLPGQLGGTGLVLLGVAGSYLALTLVAQRLGRRDPSSGGVLRGVTLATLVAIGIGLHNLGEGLAIGSSFALGALALGSFLIVGFMVHNVTEGLGIAAPIADGGASASDGSSASRSSPERRRSPARGSAGSSRTTCSASCSSPSQRAPRSRWSSRSAATSPGARRAASGRVGSAAASSQGSQ